MPFPIANPEQQGPIRRDIVILLIIAIILCCLLLLFVVGGFFFYGQFAESQAISGTATSAYMATKIKQDTQIQATQQAEATATAEAFALQATATAQALQAQASATAQAKNAELIAYDYYDPFENNNNDWRSSETEDNDFWSGSTSIQNGLYTWDVTEVKQTFVSWSDFNASESLRDFDVALKARRLSGPLTDFCYGLLFRKSQDGFSSGSYALTVCESGYFKISYYDEDVLWEIIQSWTVTSVINEDDWNLIEINARGPDFIISINNQQVAQFSDDRLEEGYISIFIDVYEESTGQFEFDFFALQVR